MSENLKGLYIKDKHTEYVVNDSINIESLSILTPEYIQEHITDFVDNDRLVVNHLIYYKVNDKLTSGEGGYVLLPAVLPFIFEAHEAGKLVYININTDGNGSYIIIDQDSFEYESGEFEGGTKVIPNTEVEDINELQRLTNVKIDNQTFSTSPRVFNLINESYNLDELPKELLDKVNIGDVLYGKYGDERGYVLTAVSNDNGFEFRGFDSATNPHNVSLWYSYDETNNRYEFENIIISTADIEAGDGINITENNNVKTISVKNKINSDTIGAPSYNVPYKYVKENVDIKYPSDFAMANARSLWVGGGVLYYSNYARQYYFDIYTREWVTIFFTGLSNFEGSHIFKYNNDTYYVNGNSCYVYIPTNRRWEMSDKSRSFNTVNGESGYSLDGKDIWTDGINLYYSNGSANNPSIGTYGQLVYDNDNNTWIPKTWDGFKPYGELVFTNGTDYYCSRPATSSPQMDIYYVLDKNTGIWNQKVWNIPINNLNIVSDGENIFYFDTNQGQYILDKVNHSWILIENNSNNVIDGYKTWTDGNTLYYTDSSTTYKLVREYLNTSASPVLDNTYVPFAVGDGLTLNQDRLSVNINDTTRVYADASGNLDSYSGITNFNTSGVYNNYCSIEAEPVTWGGLTSFRGDCIWTDGSNTYYSYNRNQYVLNKYTNTWEEKTWNGLTNFSGDFIWTDGDNIYYSSSITQYVLDKSTSTWVVKSWAGLASFDGNSLWTDGNKIYCSSSVPGNTYYLDRKESRWISSPFTGPSSFNGSNIWTDGTDLYYVHNETYQGYELYKIDPKTKKLSYIKEITQYIYPKRFITIGSNLYYANGDSLYIWDKVARDLIQLDGIYIKGTSTKISTSGYFWTMDGQLYHSSGSTHYKLSSINTSVRNKSVEFGEQTSQHLYQHNIKISIIENNESVGAATLVISNTYNTALTYDNIKSYLSSNNFKVTIGSQDYYTGNIYTLGVTGGRSGASSSYYDCIYINESTNHLCVDHSSYTIGNCVDLDDEISNGNTINVEDNIIQLL